MIEFQKERRQNFIKDNKATSTLVSFKFFWKVVILAPIFVLPLNDGFFFKKKFLILCRNIVHKIEYINPNEN